MAEKLELKNLVNYPLGLNGIEVWDKENLQVTTIDKVYFNSGQIKTNALNPNWQDLGTIELILRLLSDLTKEELDLFTVNFRMHRNNPNFNYELMIVKDYNLALSLHLDIFNLIPKGLAIDINTLK